MGSDLQALRVASDTHRITYMNGLQYQAIAPARVAPRVPWYIYAAAILLLGWAIVLLIAWLSLERIRPSVLEGDGPRHVGAGDRLWVAPSSPVGHGSSV